MLYVLGGTPRAGKTTIARGFTRATGIPWFGIDFLKMGLARGFPAYGVHPMEGDRKTARRLWPIVKEMALTYVEEEEDILLEGTYMLPEYVVELQAAVSEPMRACFVGFAEVDTRAKVEEMRRYTGGVGDWLHGEGDAVTNVEFLKEFSASIREACSQFGLKYFENSTDHPKVIDEVVSFLKG